MALELWLLSVVSVTTTVVIVTFILLIFIYLTTDPYPNKQREAVEECYLDPHTSEYIKLPFGLTERPEKQLSIIIPAYNEAERLPKMLNEAVEYLEQRKKNNSKFTYEIIVVDDGSVDHTSETAIKYSAKYGPDCVRVIKLVRNRGKGAAVRFVSVSFLVSVHILYATFSKLLTF
ncbi:Dolichyl-phosphate beta-glucosyltransferase [Fasciola gigantica]|uniref:Dolichyl-phosphate beta-glucosyltransferase n=1 Tax=Fasciola gigantica TaxID=46835 RepID=A0A504YC64_FASGI|nr:Dolichyl-phosphate beta-glucosyltransferase [Fasciola gigantica]